MVPQQEGIGMVYELAGLFGSLCKGNSSINPKDNNGKRVAEVSCFEHTGAGDWAQRISIRKRGNQGAALTTSCYFRYACSRIFTPECFLSCNLGFWLCQDPLLWNRDQEMHTFHIPFSKSQLIECWWPTLSPSWFFSFLKIHTLFYSLSWASNSSMGKICFW